MAVLAKMPRIGHDRLDTFCSYSGIVGTSWIIRVNITGAPVPTFFDTAEIVVAVEENVVDAQIF